MLHYTSNFIIEEAKMADQTFTTTITETLLSGYNAVRSCLYQPQSL